MARVARLRRALGKLVLLTLPALVLFGLLLELVARLLLPVSDFPDTVFRPEIGNHFAPDQTGTYVKGADSEIRARYRINRQGWNSPHDYQAARRPGVRRIAVIGDSYVEAIQVDADQSFSYLLEAELGPDVEVYTFGHSGANLAQYLNVLRREVCTYRPDIVLFLVIHNDYVDSLAGRGRKDNWTIRRDGDRFIEVAPEPPSNQWLKRTLRHVAIARYLVFNLDFVSRVAFVRRLFYGDAKRVEANVDTSGLVAFGGEERLHSHLRYIYGEAQSAASACGARLQLVLDANRLALYAAEDPETAAIQVLTRATVAVASELGIPLLDLVAPFAADWTQHGERFEWRGDAHWSRRGHQVVSQAIARWLHPVP